MCSGHLLKGQGSNTGWKSKLISPLVLMCFEYMEERSDVGNLYCLNMIESKDTSKPPNEKVRDLWKNKA